MKKNVFIKVFFSSVVWTAACLGLAAYAANKAEQQDPEILQKVVNKVESSSNIHVSVGDTRNRDFLPAEDSWTFATPTEAIELMSVNGDVEVVTGKPGSSLIVTAKGRRHKSLTKLLVTSATQTSVTLEQPSNDSTRELRIKVQLPPEFKGKLSIKTVNGETDMNNIALTDLKLESVSGEVEIKNSSLKNILLNTVSGEVEIENKLSGNMDLTTVSGDISLQLPRDLNADFQINSLSGELKNNFVSTANAETKIKIKSTSGDIDIK